MAIGKRNEWRYSFNPPKLWKIDARSSVILLGAGLNIHYWTVFLALVTIISLYWVEKMKRMSMNSALRLIVSSFVNLVVGRRRSPDKLRRRHFLIDYEASRSLDITAKEGTIIANGIHDAVAGIERRSRSNTGNEE